ncbi:hypothetical protein AgCh_031737 [Apium graveolens]
MLREGLWALWCSFCSCTMSLFFSYLCKIRETILDFSMMQMCILHPHGHTNQNFCNSIITADICSFFINASNNPPFHYMIKNSPFPRTRKEEINMQSSYHKIGVMVLLFFIASATSGLIVDAQSICNVPLESLATCKPAVTQPHPTAPSKECCTAVSHADMKCFCSYKNSTMLPSLGIDPVLAVHLPAKCKIRNAPKC